MKQPANIERKAIAGFAGAPGSASTFDLESVYDAEIYPLMSQIIAICKRVQMPMLASFCYSKGRNADDPEGVDYCTTVLPRGKWQAPELQEAAHIIRNGSSDRPKLMAFAITRTPNEPSSATGGAQPASKS